MKAYDKCCLIERNVNKINLKAEFLRAELGNNPDLALLIFDELELLEIEMTDNLLQLVAVEQDLED